MICYWIIERLLYFIKYNSYTNYYSVQALLKLSVNIFSLIHKNS